MPVPEKMHAPADMAECAANWTPVPLLEEIGYPISMIETG